MRLHSRGSQTVASIVDRVRRGVSIDRGDPIAVAIKGVFGDPDIRALAESDSVDRFAAFVGASWNMSELDEDEIFAGGLTLPVPPFASESQWGMAANTRASIATRALWLQVNAPRREARSLANFIVRLYDVDAGKGVLVDGSASLHSLRAIPPEGPVPGPNGPIGAWLRDTSTQWPPPRYNVIHRTFDSGVFSWRRDALARALLVELGYPSLWEGETGDVLQAVIDHVADAIEVALDHRKPTAPRPIRGMSFTPEVDWRLQQILIDRICKATYPRTWIGFLGFYSSEVWLYLASAIGQVSSVARTKEAAARLQAIATRSVAERMHRWEASRPYREERNDKKFIRHLWARVAPWTAPLGAIAGLAVAWTPEWVGSLVTAACAALVWGNIRSARRSAQFSTPILRTWPALWCGVGLSLVYSIPAGAAYLWSLGAIAFTWVECGILGTTAIVTAVAFIFAVKYPLRAIAVPSDFVPKIEGLPNDVEEQMREQIDTALT